MTTPGAGLKIMSGYDAAADVVVATSDAVEFVSGLPDHLVRLVVTSPPYNIGKSYETRVSMSDYIGYQAGLIQELVRVLVPGGSLCWQVGNHVENGSVLPLDIPYYDLLTTHGMILRNRIVWRFNHGLHASKRFSGRYETILWFTKGADYSFDLDAVRVPSKYPGKKHYKGPKAGELSGNPLGKNPGDYWEFAASEFDRGVWDIPNVKHNHPEKTDHGCQYPIELVERCVLALSAPGEWVLDPYMGVGSTLLGALLHGRRARGQQKQVSTYGRTWITKQNPITGRIHSTFRQTGGSYEDKDDEKSGANSGRLSSQSPNVQNVPTPNEDKPGIDYRACFKAKPGYLYVQADYSQIEMRIIAEVADDEAMKRIIHAGGDLHQRTASMMFNKPLDECGKGSKYRRFGKTLNFALVYGFGDQSLADELGVPLKEGRRIKQQYFDAFPRVAAFIRMSGEDPFSKGYTTTLLGRKRWYNLPDPMKLPRQEVARQNASIRNQGTNSPVQGSSADITKLAMVMVADAILAGGWDAEIINSIHDELLVEVPAAQAEAAMEIVVSEMVKAGEFFLKDVPVIVDACIADHWVKD